MYFQLYTPFEDALVVPHRRHPLLTHGGFDWEPSAPFFFQNHLLDALTANSGEKNGPAKIQNDEDKITVTVDVPGVQLRDIQVRVENGFLVVKASRHQEHCKSEFTQRVSLDETVDTSNLQANLSNGVLVVTAPKLPKPQPMVITITENASSAEEVAAPISHKAETEKQVESKNETDNKKDGEEDSKPPAKTD